MRKIILFTLIFCVCILCGTAQEKPASLNQSAASNALNPVAQVIKFQMQPNYSVFHSGMQQIDLMTRIIMPFKGLIGPLARPKNEKFFSLVRFEIPVISQTDDSVSALNATGIGDITFSDVIAMKTPWGKLGAGPCFGFPSASMTPLGAGKWTAGIVALALYHKVPSYMIGVVLNQYFSYAGSPSRPERNYMTLQPIIDFIFPKGYYILINPILIFDWHNEDYTVPVAIGFGKAFAKNLSAYIMPEYIASGSTKNSWVIQFNLNTMFGGQ